MANYKGNHSQLKKFQKGVSGNPSGRPKMDLDLRRVKEKYSRGMIEALIAKCLDMRVDELEKVLQSKKSKIIDQFIGRIVMAGIVNGDPVRFNFIVDRLVGKIGDKPEEQANQVLEIETVITPAGSIQKIERAVEVEEEDEWNTTT